MPLDGSGCHVRLSRFLFLFSFSFSFYPAPWLPSRKRTREPERSAATICERSKRRFRFSPLRFIARRANDVRIDEYDCLVASAPFQYFPIRKFFYEKRSFDSKEALWPIKRFILETRSSGTSLCPNFPLCRPCRCRFRDTTSRYDTVRLIDSREAVHAFHDDLVCKYAARPFRLRPDPEKTCSRICSGTGFRFPTR